MSILVIKLGALGDFVVADSAFKAIREHHQNETLHLLTTPPFKEFAEKLGYFDHVTAYPRFSKFDYRAVKNFIKWICTQDFHRIYDLQMVDRTALYYYFLNCS